jgi:hypothetical protein
MHRVSPLPAYPRLYARATTAVKKRVTRWPSAYASGQVVREYKKLVADRHGPGAAPYVGGGGATRAPLARWFAERWVDISTGLPCGSVKSPTYYPVCRPASAARRLSPRQIAVAVRRKQKAGAKTASYPHFFRNSRRVKE